MKHITRTVNVVRCHSLLFGDCDGNKCETNQNVLPRGHIDKNSTLENYNQVKFCIMFCKAILCQWVFCFLSLFLAICHGEVLWSEWLIGGHRRVTSSILRRTEVYWIWPAKKEKIEYFCCPIDVIAFTCWKLNWETFTFVMNKRDQHDAGRLQ